MISLFFLLFLISLLKPVILFLFKYISFLHHSFSSTPSYSIQQNINIFMIHLSNLSFILHLQILLLVWRFHSNHQKSFYYFFWFDCRLWSIPDMVIIDLDGDGMTENGAIWEMPKFLPITTAIQFVLRIWLL